MNDTVDVKPHLISFGLIYLVGMILGPTLTQLFSLNALSGISATVLFVSAYVTAIKFVDKTGRVPDKAEKWRLVWGSFAVAWAGLIVAMITLTLAFGGMEKLSALADTFGKVTAAAWGIVVLMLSVLYFTLLYVVYGWSTKKFIEKQQQLKKNT